jgi:hypothetical protein
MRAPEKATSQSQVNEMERKGTMSMQRDHSPTSHRRLRGLRALLIAAAAVVGLMLPATASAALLKSFTAEVRDQNGDPYTQAGGHPFEAFTDIDFFTHPDANDKPVPDEAVRTVHVDLPAGLVGNPQNIPQCTQADFQSNAGCPSNTQVGVTVLKVEGLGSQFAAPVFNLVPQAGVPAQFGFVALIPRVVITASVRTDGGLSVTIPNISQALPLTGTSLTFWGVPGDPAHDGDRGACLTTEDSCPFVGTVKPFLTNPTACLGPQTTVLSATSWQDPVPDVLESTTPVGADGCDAVPFDPTIQADPAVTATDSPSGLSVNVHLPEVNNPTGIEESQLRDAVVTLPEGMTLNPSAADGLGTCSQAQIGLDNTDNPTCPNSSKIGNVSIASPLQPDPLTGGIFFADPNDNPFDSLTAIYMVAQGGGVTIKLAGEIVRDPDTGRLTTVIQDAPQLPFTDFGLQFSGGPRSVIATPTTCGTKTVSADLAPWSGNTPSTVTSSFDVNSGPNGLPCVTNDSQRPFNPDMNAGLTNPVGGSSSPFTFQVTRPDGNKWLKGLSVDLPVGVLAKIAGTAECSDGALASIDTSVGSGQEEIDNPSCPAGSQVGTATIGAGAGTQPEYVQTGKVYLAGPYKGAPFSLAIVVPAVAGPLDLGTVVVRNQLKIDSDDAQVHVVSDEIPDTLAGIPLRLRDIQLSIDKPGFMQGPTNCSPLTVNAQITGSDGGSANLSKPFQMAGCAALPFNPTLSASILNGRSGTTRSSHPALQVNVGGTPGGANILGADVLLPPAFQVDQANLGNLCSESELASNQCAGRNTIGSASATTPLLDQPLSGPVYAVSGSGGLPRLAMILNGPASQPVQLIVRADTVTRGNQIASVISAAPDAQINGFTLTIDGGSTGYLVNNTNLCSTTKKAKKKKGKKGKKKQVRTSQVASATFTGQNGATSNRSTTIAMDCPAIKKAKKKKKKK